MMNLFALHKYVSGGYVISSISPTSHIPNCISSSLVPQLYPQCWRVPSKIWLGLPDGHLGHFKADEKKKAAAAKASASAGNEDSPSSSDDDDDDDDAAVNSTKFKQYAKALDEMNCVVLAGFGDLPKKDRNEFVLHVMDRQNWAQKRKAPRKNKAKKEDGEEAAEEDSTKKQPSGVAVPSLDGFINDFDMDEGAKKPAAAAAAPAAGGVDMLVAVAKSVGDGEAGVAASLALKKEKFVAPVPGVGLGVAGALDGLRFVLT